MNRNKNHRHYRSKNSLLKDRIPPTVDPRPMLQRKVRFTASNTLSAVPITSLCFFRLMGLVVSGTNAIHFTKAAYRIRSIKIYAANTTSGFSTIILEWFSTYNRNKELTDTGTSAYPAFIRSNPPPDSDAGNWLSTDSDLYNNVLFTISAPASTIIDVSMDVVDGDGTNTFASGTLTAAAAFTGNVIMRLDNITASGTTGGQLIIPAVNTSLLYF